jgi:hypothetical protein
MSQNNFDPNSLYSKLMGATNAIDQQHFASAPEEVYQVQIRVDEKIGPAMFKPDPFIPGGYKANSLTIKAMRPDVFVGGDEVFEDLEVLYNCIKCDKELDLQFWKFCPYCEAHFPKDL